MSYIPIVPRKKKKYEIYVDPSILYEGGEIVISGAVGQFLVDESDNHIVDENNDKILWE